MNTSKEFRKREDNEMPFIDSKISVPVSPEKKESLKAAFGKAITTLNKTETYLMVGFDDNYTLYMGGEKLEKGAYVSVSLLGSLNAPLCNKMTAQICEILEKELAIPQKNIYVTYHGLSDWGWNGSNF